MTRRNVTVWLRLGRLSARLDARTTALDTIVVVLIVLGIVGSAVFGQIHISPLDVARAVIGQGNHLDQLIVRQFRLARVLEGALVGAMLGMSGALFQRMVQNPLVAPDIIGVNTGAAAAAVAVIILGVNQDLVPLAAFGGGIAAAALGYALSLRRGLSPYRLVLVGIAINALIGTVMDFLLSIPAVSSNQTGHLASAADWLNGNLDNALWSQVQILAIAFAVLAPAAILLGRGLDVLALGEAKARSLSLRVGMLRSAVIVVGVLLAATAVSQVGLIGFIAFISPHIARRVARNSAAGSIPLSGLVGALLLMVSDYVAKRILEPTQLPVGIVTILLGAPYFFFLLYRAGRRGNVI